MNYVRQWQLRRQLCCLTLHTRSCKTLVTAVETQTGDQRREYHLAEMTSSASSAASQKMKSHFCSHLQGINLELFLGLQGASCFSVTITLSKIFLPREGFLTVKKNKPKPKTKL